jgi:alkylhydroperoxidase family enzyme
MPNLIPVEPDQSTGKTRELYDYIQTNAGRIPNLFRLMGNSPVALKAYLDFSATMRQSALPKGLAELLGVAATAACGAEYTAIGARGLAHAAGLSEAAISQAQAGRSDDPKTAAALAFAQSLVERRGEVGASEVAALRAAGFSDADVAELVAVVALNLYRSYFSSVADPELDFERA